MSQTTIWFRVSENGRSVDFDEVPNVEDESAVNGVVRTDTGASVVDSETAFTRTATGTYKLTFDDPESDLTYEYYLKYTYQGQTMYAVRRVNSGSIVTNLLAIGTQGHYTTYSEVLKQLGVDAVELMLEDWETSDTSDVWDAILTEVDEKIDMFIGQRYDVGAFTNPLLRRHATVLAAYILSTRRGNPGIFLPRVRDTYEVLEGIKSGEFHVKGLKPKGWFNAPHVRNYVMQPNYRFPVRVDKMKSTGNSFGPEVLAYTTYMYSYVL